MTRYTAPDFAVKTILVSIFLYLPFNDIFGQLSPGELSSAHSSLEGMSNCTKCHELGNKQTNEKCLACHSEISERISARKGYHSSVEVSGKKCFECHSEHNGRSFQLIRLDTRSFDHSLTGYVLSVPHAKKECRDCHVSGFITEPRVKNKKNTYLGVNPECLNCHADYHLRTLSVNCLSCHSQDAFVPAGRFSHDKAKFKLAGKHRTVECVKCHRITINDGRKFQQFTGIQYTNCASCHKDPHQNQFGQNCRQCHSEESFRVVQGMQKFDHNKTGYRLEGKHMIVNCRQCHKGKFTDPLKYGRCNDCHTDYHAGQFVKNGIVPDCAQCHDVNGFTRFTFTQEQHNQGRFPLKGSHLAIPCYECHKKKEKWNFRAIGINCTDCHQNIHQDFIPEKYYGEAGCANCHNEKIWSDISFDHQRTGYILTGAHKDESCRACHFKSYASGTVQQSFSDLPKDCSECHSDKHRNQFDKNGSATCTDCHNTENWKPSVFDHNKTAFRLEGKHLSVRCAECHKPQNDAAGTYILYKIKDFRCESCHF